MARRIIASDDAEATDNNSPNGDGIHAQSSKLERAQELGIMVDRTCCWHDTYTGTAESLVAAGVVGAHQLPGQPGGPKVSATYYRGVPARNSKRDEHYMCVVRRSKNQFQVTLGLPAAEQDRRQREAEATRAAAAARQQRSRRVSDEWAEESNATATPDQYRQYLTDHPIRLWNALTTHTAASFLPFSLSPGDTDRVLGVLRDLYAILNTAEIRSLKESAARVSLARSDVAFQAFLSNQGLRQDAQAQHG